VILLISLAFSKSAISVLIPHVDTQPEWWVIYRKKSHIVSQLSTPCIWYSMTFKAEQSSRALYFYFSYIYLFYFIMTILGFELRASRLLDRHSTYILSHSTSPIFLWRVFQARVLRTICLGWLWTSILLISASWVARIIGVSHRHPAISFYFSSIYFLVLCTAPHMPQCCLFVSWGPDLGVPLCPTFGISQISHAV
jgi:hypothetical protein